MHRARRPETGRWVDAVRSRLPLGRADRSPGEHLLGAFARLFGENGRMEIRRQAPTSLGPTDLPCVLVLKDGGGLPLLERSSDGRFRAETTEGERWFDATELARWHAGTILVCAGRQAAPAAPRRPEIQEGEETSLLMEIGKATLASPLLPQLFVAAALGNLFVFALPTYSMAVYDRIIPHKALETLWALTGGLLIVLMLDLFCRSMRNRIVETIGIWISLRLQEALYGRHLASELARAERRSGVLSSGLGALDAACLLAPAILVGALVDLPFMVLILLYVVSIAHWVVLAPVLALIGIVGVNVAAHFAGRRAFAAGVKHAVGRTGMIEEGARTLEVIKSVGGEQHARERWAQSIDAVSYHAHVGRSATAFAGQMANTLLQAGTVLSLVIGVFLINAGDMTVGALSAAVLLTSRTIAPVSALAAAVVKLLSLSESLVHVRSLRAIDRETQGDEARTPARLQGRIRLAQVSFRYPKESRPALSEISLSIEPGERVGIIGRIGSGKSTLAHLVPRLYTPDSGSVLVDDHDVRQYDPAWLRRHVAFMPQDCELLEASIHDNIVRGLDRVDDEAFARAVHASGVKDFVSAHPAGYGMVVGPTGRRLSGGERQAVCLARTLVRDAPVLVLDEPTSAMDSQLEARVVERLQEVVAGRTLIVATHRAPLLRLVDRVIWLEGGRIVADGPTAEVLQQAARAA